jgi:hypothetical protein
MNDEDIGNAPDVLRKLGADFAMTIEKDRKAAWKNMMRGIVTNLDILVLARVTQPLRDVISMVGEIDEMLGGGQQGNATEPLDAIAQRWTLPDEAADGGGTEKYKN